MFDLWGLINDIFDMISGFAQKFYDILSYQIVIPNVIWSPIDLLFDLSDIPPSFSVLAFMGGALILLIVFSGIIKAVNFLW